MAKITNLPPEVCLKIAENALESETLPELSHISWYWASLCRQVYDEKCCKKSEWMVGDHRLWSQKERMNRCFIQDLGGIKSLEVWHGRDPDRWGADRLLLPPATPSGL